MSNLTIEDRIGGRKVLEDLFIYRKWAKGYKRGHGERDHNVQFIISNPIKLRWSSTGYFEGFSLRIPRAGFLGKIGFKVWVSLPNIDHYPWSAIKDKVEFLLADAKIKYEKAVADENQRIQIAVRPIPVKPIVHSKRGALSEAKAEGGELSQHDESFQQVAMPK